MRFRVVNYFKKRSVKQFMVFIGIAFLFFMFSKLSNSYKQNVKLKIEVTNLDEELIIANDSSNVLTTYIEADGFSLSPLIFKNQITIELDAKKDLNRVNNTLIFDVQKNRFLIDKQLGDSYKVLSIRPDTLNIEYYKMASKYVPVLVKSDIKYAVGYDLFSEFTITPDSIKLVGSDVQLSKIDNIPTDLLKLSNISTDINQQVDLDASELIDIDVYPETVNIHGTVKRFTEGTLEIPIQITKKPADITINYFPKVVSVSYYVDLENYGTITAEQFSVECEYQSNEDGNTFLTPKVSKFPNVVKRVSIKPNRIDFIQL